MNELLLSIRNNAIGLSLFALITVGSIALAYSLTSQRIATNIAQAQAKALNDIVPKEQYDNDLLNSTLPLLHFDRTLLGPVASDAVIYRAMRSGNITTLLIPAIAPDGYTQNISLLVGIHADGTLAGVRVTEHRETPGLGDKIDHKKSDWILGFLQKSLTNPAQEHWLVKKDGGDFDQLTGATITPRAIVKAVKHTLQFFHQYQDRLLMKASETPALPVSPLQTEGNHPHD